MPKDYVQELPEAGYVVIDPTTRAPIAAGFIRRCEGGYALLDGYITDPTAPGEAGDAALDLLTAHVAKAAAEMGFKLLLAFCKDENTIMRAQRHGFNVLPHAFLSLNLAKVK